MFGYKADKSQLRLYLYVDPVSPPSKEHIKIGTCAFGGGGGYRPRVRTSILHVTLYSRFAVYTCFYSCLVPFQNIFTELFCEIHNYVKVME